MILTLFLLIVLGIISILLIVRIPAWQAERALKSGVAPKDLPGLENEFRKTMVQIIGGIAVLAGLFFAWRELETTREQMREEFRGSP